MRSVSSADLARLEGNCAARAGMKVGLVYLDSKRLDRGPGLVDRTCELIYNLSLFFLEVLSKNRSIYQLSVNIESLWVSFIFKVLTYS